MAESKNNQIMYALVARGTSVLCECVTKDSANAPLITRMILNKIPADDAKMSYESNDFMVHYKVQNTITYLCVAGKKMNIDSTFEFLNKINVAFHERYGDCIQNLKAYDIDEEFKSVILGQMNVSNETEDGGKDIDVLKEKVDCIQKIAASNFNRLITRDEHINTISYKSNLLQEDAKEFEKGAVELKRHFFLKNLKMLCCLFSVLLVVIYLIVSMMCGFTLKKCI